MKKVLGVIWDILIVIAMVIILLVWSLVPMAFHAIERGLAFWIVWSLVEVGILAALWNYFRPIRKKEPIQ